MSPPHSNDQENAKFYSAVHVACPMPTSSPVPRQNCSEFAVFYVECRDPLSYNSDSSDFKTQYLGRDSERQAREATKQY